MTKRKNYFLFCQKKGEIKWLICWVVCILCRLYETHNDWGLSGNCVTWIINPDCRKFVAQIVFPFSETARVTFIGSDVSFFTYFYRTHLWFFVFVLILLLHWKLNIGKLYIHRSNSLQINLMILTSSEMEN